MTEGLVLSCLQMARAFGGRIIIAVDISDKKLENAMKMGATHTINGSTEDVPERIRVSHLPLQNRFADEIAQQISCV